MKKYEYVIVSGWSLDRLIEGLDKWGTEGYEIKSHVVTTNSVEQDYHYIIMQRELVEESA